MKYVQVKVDKLIPYVNNARKHSDNQITQIAASIVEFGFLNPVIIDKNLGIIAGHGRVEAAKKLGLTEVPCLRVEHLSESQKKAYIIADNRLAELAEWDEQLLKVEIETLRESNFDIKLTGFDNESPLLTGDGSEDEHPSMYTRNVEIPTYQPTSETKPEMSEVIDLTKYQALVAEIDARKDLPKQDREMLKLAASRHIVFNYQNLAEYYTHSTKEVQELMENSALVIIDFQKAIANGFVRLTEKIASQFAEEYPPGTEEAEEDESELELEEEPQIIGVDDDEL